MIKKPILKFKGAVENGNLLMLNDELWRKHLNGLQGEVIITCEKKRKNRTIPQNSLYWLWLTILEDSTGQPKEDFHDYYKKRYLLKMVSLKAKDRTITEKVVGSTTDLDSFAFTQYLEKVQQSAMSDFGVYLPSPDEIYF